MSVQAVIWLPLAASVLLGASASRLGRLLPPATAVRLLTAASLMCALGTGFALTVAGFVVLAQVPAVAALGHWSSGVVRNGHLVPVAAGGPAGVVVTVLLASALWRALRAGHDLALSALLCRRLGPAVAGLVVVEDDIPDAYALPGLSGRVVVSTAMLAALPADERAVLLAHEAAHLAHRHYAYVQLADLAAAANPVLRPVARAVRVAVERWADEVAAAEVGDRRLAARALARAGLARAAASRRTAADPVLAAGTALAALDAHVADRALALLGPLPPARRALAVVVLAATVATGAASVITEHVTEARFELAQIAYDHHGSPRGRSTDEATGTGDRALPAGRVVLGPVVVSMYY